MLPITLINLISLLLTARPSAEVEAFGKHIYEINEDIWKKTALSNENYKVYADLKRRFAKFNKVDMVMVRIKPE